MKKICSILLAVCLLLALAACGNSQNPADTASSESSATSESVLPPDTSSETQEPSGQDTPDEGTAKVESKILIAFFSRADENYDVGYIDKGNTHIIAEMIADETSGDLFHIERETPYPDEYDACTDEAKAEQNNNARPALKEDIDISEYDVIFLGYPNWWGDMPMPVYTFLEGHDFTGKTVIPFCTHAGSGLSGTVSSISNITGATMLDGFAIAGTIAQNSQDEALASVQSWLSGLSLPE